MPQGASSRTKYTYIWVSAIVLVFGIFTVLEVAKRVKDDTIVDTKRAVDASGLDKLSYILADGQKRKVPDFSFTNQHGRVITNADYLGKVYVVDFFFTTCPTICPIMTQNLVELQRTFKDAKDFGIASFTINPKYDTPEVLKAYAAKYGAARANWNFMTGDKNEIYHLSEAGFYFMAREDSEVPGGFEHSGLFALVDKQGYLRSRVDANGNPLIYYRGTITEAQGVSQEGEAQQITMLKEDINRLLNE